MGCVAHSRSLSGDGVPKVSLGSRQAGTGWEIWRCTPPAWTEGQTGRQRSKWGARRWMPIGEISLSNLQLFLEVRPRSKYLDNSACLGSSLYQRMLRKKCRRYWKSLIVIQNPMGCKGPTFQNCHLLISSQNPMRQAGRLSRGCAPADR